MTVDHNNQTWSPLVHQNMHYIYIQEPLIKV